MEDLTRISIDPIKFKGARERAGKTQKEVAEAVGVKKAAISKIECGLCLPSSSVLVRFCLFTNTSIAELITGRELGSHNHQPALLPTAV
jgi:transcriptional regulator with XRE-family HTH domain